MLILSEMTVIFIMFLSCYVLLVPVFIYFNLQTLLIPLKQPRIFKIIIFLNPRHHSFRDT